jgi:hypothetical protein
MHSVFQAKIHAVPWEGDFQHLRRQAGAQKRCGTAERWRLRVPTGQGVSRDLGNDVLRLCQLLNKTGLQDLHVWLNIRV